MPVPDTVDTSSKTTSKTDTTLSILAQMKQAIWARRPILGEILAKHGQKTLYNYCKDFADVNTNPVLDARKGELIATAEGLIAERLGPTVGAGVARQLRKRPLVSTIDHHGSIDHPFFVNCNIVSMLPDVELNDPDIAYQVVFSFASVSVNNASAYPRGLEFHGGEQGAGDFIRLPILPDRLKMGVVYSMRPFTRDDLHKAEGQLQKKEKDGQIAPGRGEKIREIMETYFGNADVLGAPDLAAQVAKINYAMWPKFFRKNGNLTGEKVSDLIYLEIETLVRELLLRYHLSNTDSLIYRALFSAPFQQLILNYFNGIPGAFSHEKKWGTYLFWAIENETLHRVGLMLENGKLVSADGRYTFDLTPEALIAALKDKKIFPSMLLCYLLVSLYYGMKCLGGFCQVHDLSMAKAAWQKLLTEVGEISEAEAVAPVQTKELGGDGMVLAYLRSAVGDLTSATGIDMMIDNIDTSFAHYSAIAKQLTLTEIMDPMIPEMYTVLYASHERVPEWLTITPAGIMEATGLKKKLEK